MHRIRKKQGEPRIRNKKERGKEENEGKDLDMAEETGIQLGGGCRMVPIFLLRYRGQCPVARWPGGGEKWTGGQGAATIDAHVD